MSRRMSCSLTIDAVRERRKTVTRRHVDTWKDLKPGDRLTLIEKGMGLPKGAKQVVIAEVEITDVRVEAIGFVHHCYAEGADRLEVTREGLPDMTPVEFITMWLQAHGYGTRVNDPPTRRHALSAHRVAVPVTDPILPGRTNPMMVTHAFSNDFITGTSHR